MEPTNAWAVVRDNEIIHVRLVRALAEASANIERNVYGWDNVKIIPVLMTEIKDADA